MNYPQIMKDINIFVDGIGHLGTSEEIKLPVIKFKTEGFNRGGFEKEISLGTFEKLEAEATIAEYDPIVYAAIAAGTVTGLGVNITVKGSILQKRKHISAVATLQGEIDVEDGSWKANEKIQRKMKMRVNLYAMEIGGTQAILFDTENMIAMIDGVDYLASLRSHIQ